MPFIQPGDPYKIFLHKTLPVPSNDPSKVVHQTANKVDGGPSNHRGRGDVDELIVIVGSVVAVHDCEPFGSIKVLIKDILGPIKLSVKYEI